MTKQAFRLTSWGFSLCMFGFAGFAYFGPKEGVLCSVLPLAVLVLSVTYTAVNLYYGWTAKRVYRLYGDELGQARETSRRLHSAEDRLDDLERLKRREMVTPEEYTAKRQEILKDL